MAISLSTMKRLFAKSQNRCAMPRCQSLIVIGDRVIGEVCHIRARRKNGARYDPSLTTVEKDEFKNLILMCPTCHTLADKDPNTYTIDLLADIKEMHERPAPLEITSEITRLALLILAKHENKVASHSPVNGDSHATASIGGIAISVGGHNLGTINVHSTPKAKSAGISYPANSIGGDANMTNYVEYLCQLYVDYMRPSGRDENELWAIIGRAIKTKFRLRKRTRNHLSADRFPDLVEYLVHEKIAKTPVGKKHLSRGTKLCRSFGEFRHGMM